MEEESNEVRPGHDPFHPARFIRHDDPADVEPAHGLHRFIEKESQPFLEEYPPFGAY